MSACSICALYLLAPAMLGTLTIQDDGQHATVLENGQPVLVYNYGEVTPPENVDAKFRRSCYIHPLYGLDGEVMTQDFPFDHRHHRGVFWAWPTCTVGERKADIWILDGVRQTHEKWLKQDTSGACAELEAQNVWRFDDAPDLPTVRETVSMHVWPADGDTRPIDFRLVFENVGTEEVTICGSVAEDKGSLKGYGGLCYRPDAKRMPMSFTAAGGPVPEDVFTLDTPWCDVAFPKEKDGKELSGLAIFQHPHNIDYPDDGWLVRHYGFLGASWPRVDPYHLKPGQSVTLLYRMLLHRGDAASAGVAAAYKAYAEQAAAEK